MGRINLSRVLLGGLIAGLVMNLGEFVLNGVILAEDFEAAMAEHNLPEMTTANIGVFVAFAFLWGLVAVWLYAAARPRLGPGIATAVKVALALWLVAYLLPTIGYAMMGLLSSGGAVLTAVWGLVEVPLATVAGAWLYREEASPAGQPAAMSHAGG